jgi:D-alanine--poly(phosphoribitol) ligase subunit 1
VIVSRPALTHYTNWAIKAMAVSPKDRWSQHPNIGFDLSVLDIYAALCAGATLHPLTSDRDRLFPGEAIRRHKLTVWNSVPSVIDLIKRAKQATETHLSSLRLLTFCGEPLLEDHLRTIFSAHPDAVVHNTYGPTEATVSFTLVRLTIENYKDSCQSSVTVGEPIPGMTLILDGGNTDEEGEIIVAGPQVANGYWQDPQQTADTFSTILLDGHYQPSYRTGDWAAYHEGKLYFRNRIDRQVKIQGNRLELGDVDAALRAAGARAACTIMEKGRLYSFVESDLELDSITLRTAVTKRLPKYGVPTAIYFVPSLPLNSNDKVDTAQLKEIIRLKRH